MEKKQHVLIKFNGIKLLIDTSLAEKNVLKYIDDIQQLDQRWKKFLINIHLKTDQETKAFQAQQKAVKDKINAWVIGEPLTMQDAELYAHENKINFQEIEIV